MAGRMGQPVSQLPQNHPARGHSDRTSSPRKSSNPPQSNPYSAGTQHYRMSFQPTSVPRVSETSRPASLPRGNDNSRGGSPCPRGSDGAPRSSSLRGNDAVRSILPLRANEVSQSTSSRRGNELSQGPSSLQQATYFPQSAFPQRRSEAARRDSSPRGANLPQETSSRRGSDFPQSFSQRQPSSFSRNAPSRGSTVPSGASSRRESGFSQSTRESNSPQRGWLTDQNISPPGTLDCRSGRCSLQSGQLSMGTSQMLAMQQGLNSQWEEMCQKHQAGSQMVPRPRKSQMEDKLILSSSPPPPPLFAKRVTRPIANSKDESTQTTDLKKAPRFSLPLVNESGRHDLPQMARKSICKHVPNSKDACTQTEPVYRLSVVRSEPPQIEVLTIAKTPLLSEARRPTPNKTSLLSTTTIKVSPQSEAKLRHRSASHPESESDYRCALHQEMEAPHKSSFSPETVLPYRGSLSTDNELKRSSRQKGPDTAHRSSLLTAPELRKISLQAGPPLNQRGSLQKENRSVFKPAYHPGSESEYRCPLHLEMEETLSVGPEISHRSSLSREIEPSLGISLGLKQECFSRPCPSSKNESAQTELFSSVPPCMEIKPGVRHSIYPNADACLSASPYAEAALPPMTLPMFGPQCPCWLLLQKDTHPPAPPEIIRRISSPLVLDCINEGNTSLPGAERTWQMPSSPAVPEWMHGESSSLAPQEIMGHSPPILDMIRHISISPPQPPGERGGRLDSLSEVEVASDSSRIDISTPCQDSPKLEAIPELLPTAAEPGEGGQWLERAGPSHKTEDLMQLSRGRSTRRLCALYMGTL